MKFKVRSLTEHGGLPSNIEREEIWGDWGGDWIEPRYFHTNQRSFNYGSVGRSRGVQELNNEEL